MENLTTKREHGGAERPTGSRDQDGVSTPSLSESDAASGADPDACLIEGIARGDERAVAQLVDKYLTRITNNALRVLGNRDDAEEVAQEVFIRIWNNMGRWEYGRAKFSTWIYRITMNLCFDRLRKHREVAMADPPDWEDDRPQALEVLAEEQMAQAVQTAVQALPERQRAALSLCYFDNLSNIEAADILEVSVDALESLLARGRRGLKKLLEDKKHLLEGM